MHTGPGSDLLEGLLSRKRPAPAPLIDLYERDQGLLGGPASAGHLGEPNPASHLLHGQHHPNAELQSIAGEDSQSQEGQGGAGNLHTGDDTEDAGGDRDSNPPPMLTETLALGAQDLAAQMQGIEEKIHHLVQHSVQRLDAIKDCFVNEVTRFVQDLRASCGMQSAQWCDLAAETMQESKRLDMAKELVGSLGLAASMPHAPENEPAETPSMLLNTEGPGV